MTDGDSVGKKALYLVIFVLMFFALKENTYAISLDRNYYVTECIFSDGSLITRTSEKEYEGRRSWYNDSYDRSIYNLMGAKTQDAASGGTLEFHKTMNLQQNCPSKIYIVDYNDVKHISFEDKLIPSDLDETNSGWCKFWGCTSGNVKEAQAAIDVAIEGSLVSERYILNGSAPDPDETIYFVMPAEQASGNNAYIKIHFYGSTALLEKDGRITQLKEFPDNIKTLETVYLNDADPTATTSSAGAVSYYFTKGQVRYALSATQTGVYKYAYEKTEPPEDSGVSKSSLCDVRLKNTSPILRDGIKYMQIIVPILIILLTSLDIGKIVMTGNVEEELPKRKKLIIGRAIVALSFFFLPLFIKMGISLLKDSGIGKGNQLSDSIEYIDCLFQ